MWIILLIPLILIGGIFMSSRWIISCFSHLSFSIFRKFSSFKSSNFLTRILYALLFILNCLFSWLMRSNWAVKKLEKLTPGIRISCPEERCYGVLSVHRINFSLGLLHLILAGLLVGVRSNKQKRACIQDGFWAFKIIGWSLIVMTAFLINDSFFIFWGNYFSFIGSIMFILFGLFLLIDFAYSWAEICYQKYEIAQNNLWKTCLVGSTLFMYFATIILMLVMCIFFAKPGCSLNQLVIFINFIFLLVITTISIHPTVQDYNPQSGLAQSATVCLYTTYLTVSALSNEPIDPNNPLCNPMAHPSHTKTINIIFDAIFTFLAIAYNTSRAAVHSIFLYSKNDFLYYERLKEENDDEPIIDKSLHEMKLRQKLLEASVETGSLPPSALNDSDDIFNDLSDRNSVEYNYSVFHFIFFLATCYTTCLLTGWGTLKTQGNKYNDNGPFLAIGYSYSIVWMKIFSSWICHGLYIWTCIAPVLFPDRFY
ncbi:hypothetical protein T552_02998 [Pneumocystis carinii B80]|uniref:Membrane protein TMS1 n=1 Tax=Pneumocystis carinii (strain B80) TaxID=1408658 RepID=A0A0W4ZCE6_PNEC8|nr:hypothetical protein T552_02998 [Pneumocystis carinii B80]KTW26104.1 hypothetical protein T552_02998 [Pneumocystis carinii B80]